MDAADAAALKREIEGHYGTVYRFVKVSGLPKSAVYWLLSGRYPSDPARLLARIRSVLAAGAGHASAARQLDVAAVAETLERVACSRCTRLDRRRRGCCNPFARRPRRLCSMCEG